MDRFPLIASSLAALLLLSACAGPQVVASRPDPAPTAASTAQKEGGSAQASPSSNEPPAKGRVAYLGTRGQPAKGERVEPLLSGGDQLAEIGAALTNSEGVATAGGAHVEAHPPMLDSPIIPVGDAPRRGPDHALVTIVEFTDFQCPYCSKAQRSLQEAMRLYDGQVRLVLRHFPLAFHPDAIGAAEAQLAAHAQGRGWDMHDLLFAHQRELTREDLDEYARRLGLDLGRFQRDLATRRFLPVVEEDLALVEALGLRGTPVFIINGVPLMGARPLEDFRMVIERELAEAELLLEAGVPREEVYGRRIKDNLRRFGRRRRGPDPLGPGMN